MNLDFHADFIKITPIWSNLHLESQSSKGYLPQFSNFKQKKNTDMEIEGTVIDVISKANQVNELMKKMLHFFIDTIPIALVHRNTLKRQPYEL